MSGTTTKPPTQIEPDHLRTENRALRSCLRAIPKRSGGGVVRAEFRIEGPEIVISVPQWPPADETRFARECAKAFALHIGIVTGASASLGPDRSFGEYEEYKEYKEYEEGEGGDRG
jgi:hypothetical protein